MPNAKLRKANFEDMDALLADNFESRKETRR